MPFSGESLTWLWLPPLDALGTTDPSLLESLAGDKTHVASFLLRSPFPAGADENGFLAQLREVSGHYARLSARARLRKEARAEGDRVLKALIARGDAVYRLEPGPTRHRIVGITAGTKGLLP
jgi:hypothetical protein